ncbi:hypothetical protein E4T42_05902 [Aureobasidium subglaciale]|nr:hypothetical protein E4T42_05902 [Aureobasidium subglaciale]
MSLVTSLPPELDVFLDFVSDDDRPTFILEYSSQPKVVFRNNALNALLTESSHDSRFSIWVNTLYEIIGDHAGRHVRHIAKLGAFASRLWSCKRLQGPWMAVFSRQEDPSEDRPNVRKKQKESNHSEQLWADDDGERESDNDSQQESDAISTTPSSMSTMNATKGFQQDTGPLEDMAVDWLKSRHLTSDPWMQFLAKHDWSKTAAGPMQTWDPYLRQSYSTILSSTEPRVLYWGNELCMFYNDAARFLVGKMHPTPLGNPMAKVWVTHMSSHLIGILKSGIRCGKPLHNKRTELVISCFFDFVFLSVPSPDGRFKGFINEFTEITTAVLQENRQEVCKHLIEDVTRATETRDVWGAFVDALQECKDVAFATVYTHVSPGVPGWEESPLTSQVSFGIEQFSPNLSSSVREHVRKSGNKVLILDQSSNTLPQELAVAVEDLGVVHTSYILPIDNFYGGEPSAIVVIGSNPVRAVDAGSMQFFEALRDLLFKSIALLSLPAEQRRANELTTALSHQLAVVTSKAEKSEKNFTEMVHHAPIGMCMDRGDGYPIYVNDMYLELLGMDRTTFYQIATAGFSWRSVVFKDDADSIEEMWWAAVMSGKTTSFEIRVKSGLRFRWFEVSVQQRYDGNGELTFVFSWLIDISARKLMESVVEERLAEAIENKRASENFIDMISHEMRNPLSSILQLADSIPLTLPPAVTEDESSSSGTNGSGCLLTEDTRHVLLDTAQTITLCAKHQRNIIDEVLTFSKLDSKLLMLAPEKVQPLKILSDVLKMNKPELVQANIEGSLDVQASFTDLGIDYVFLDPGRVSQVIINFMNNAIKFTRNSEVREIKIILAASRTRPTADSCHVTLIEPRKKERSLSVDQGVTGPEVFLTFNVQDTGCGLSEAETENLFQRFSQASPKTYKRYGGSGLGLFISRELVELQGGQVGVHSEAGKGSTFGFYIKATCVERPLETEPKSPELGKSRPTMTTDQIAATPANTAEEPAVDKTEVQDLHVLGKHFDGIQERHILIVFTVVEDNTINQRVMSQQLSRLGCAKVHVANHGLEALNLLSTTTFCNGEVPLSIVLLDVEMPIMDGLTCVRRVRELEKLQEINRHVPICGITANARTDQIASCIEAGMDEVVTKPFRMPELVPRMLALVDKHKPQ